MLRWLVGSLLRSTARRQFANVLSPAEDRAATANRTDESISEPHEAPRCQLAVVSADPEVTNVLNDRLAGMLTTQAAGFVVHTGRLARRRVAVATPGGDARVLAQAAQALVDAYQPRLVVTIGLGVALTDELTVGDLLVACRIVSPAGTAIVLEVAQCSGAQHSGTTVRTGTLVTPDAMPATPQARRALGELHQALAAELSAYPVAEVCRQQAVPMMAVAAITASVDNRLPQDIQHMDDQHSRAGLAGALIGNLVRRPASAKDLWRRQQSVWQASDQLADFLEALLT